MLPQVTQSPRITSRTSDADADRIRERVRRVAERLQTSIRKIGREYPVRPYAGLSADCGNESAVITCGAAEVAVRYPRRGSDGSSDLARIDLLRTAEESPAGAHQAAACLLVAADVALSLLEDQYVLVDVPGTVKTPREGMPAVMHNAAGDQPGYVVGVRKRGRDLGPAVMFGREYPLPYAAWSAEFTQQSDGAWRMLIRSGNSGGRPTQQAITLTF